MDLRGMFRKHADIGEITHCLESKGLVKTIRKGRIYLEAILTEKGRISARVLEEDQSGESRLCG
jgi:hypothetical protein